MRFIGRVDGVDVYKKKNESLRTNVMVRDILMKNNLPIKEMEEKYGITSPNLDSFYKDSAKYDRNHHFVANKELFMEAIKYWQKRFQRFVPCSNVFTDEEAIRRSDVNTSPGWSANKKYATKKQVVLNHSPFLRKILENIKKGKLHDLVLKLADKIEIREFDKIADNKVRTFAPIPIEFHVAFVKYFGALAEAIMALDPSISHNCAGWSNWYGGWNEFMKNFDKFDEFIDLDARKFDGSIISELREMIWEGFWSKFFLDPKERAEAKLVYFSMMNPYIITPDGLMFQLPNGGRFSGELLTLLENSLINLFMYTYCALRKQFDLDEFFKNTASGFMGDDILAAQYSTGKFRFTVAEITQFYFECNIEFHEGGEFKKDLSQVSFLSLTPFRINDYWLFYPNIEKVLFSLSVSKSTSSNAEVMQKLCILYAYSYFSTSREYVDRIKQCCVDFAIMMKEDEDVISMYHSFDIENIARMFFPMRHISAASLNLQADKSRNLDFMKTTIHETNPLRNRDISGKNKNRPQGIDLSGRGIVSKKEEKIRKDRIIEKNTIRNAEKHFEFGKNKLNAKPVKQPIETTESNGNYGEAPKPNYNIGRKELAIGENPLHSPDVDTDVREAYASQHRIQNNEATLQDKEKFEESPDWFPFNYMSPYRSDGEFVESKHAEKHARKPVNGDDYVSKYHDGDFAVGKQLDQPADSFYYDWADSLFLDRIKDSNSWSSYLASGAIYASKTLRRLRRLLLNKNFDETDIKQKIEQLKMTKNKEIKKVAKMLSYKSGGAVGRKLKKALAPMKRQRIKVKSKAKAIKKTHKFFDKGMTFNRYPNKGAKNFGNKPIRRRLRLFLDTLTATTSQVAGSVINTYPINPQALFGATEIGMLSTWYERWTCHKYRVCYEPGVTNTQNGSWGSVVDPDFTDQTIANGGAYNPITITQNPSFHQMPFQGAQTTSQNDSQWFYPLQKKLWCSPAASHDPTLVYAGRLITVCILAPGDNAATGILYLDIDITFWGKFMDSVVYGTTYEDLAANASTLFNNPNAADLGGRYSGVVFPLKTSNSISIGQSGEYFYYLRYTTTSAPNPSVGIDTAPANGSFTFFQNFFASNTGSAYAINTGTFVLTGASLSNPGFLGFNPGTNLGTTLPVIFFIFPVDGYSKTDALVARSVFGVNSDLNFLTRELKELKIQLAEMQESKSAKDQKIIEIISTCKHKRTLYEPLASYQKFRKMIGDDACDQMNDYSICEALKFFDMAPKLSQ